jgi:glycosyltransferase involved in cell wall biosynthesis
MTHPMVSVICPTYNRREFLPYLIYMFNYQTYPKHRRELIILDDSPTSNLDVIEKYNVDKNIKYKHLPEKIKLGKKRNMLNSMVTGEYVVCMDDDDYYPPERVSHAITILVARKGLIAGCSEMYIYFTKLDAIYNFKKIGNHHSTNGTFAYHKSIIADYSYDDTAICGEEKHFLKNYTAPMIQLNPLKSMICMCHSTNTFDKNIILPNLTKLSLKLKKEVKDKYLMDWFTALGTK